MTAFLTVIHVTVCLLLIVVVLLQRGKGADMGAMLGGGASSTVFGSRGPGNFLTKITTGAVVVFFVTSLSLSYIATRDTGLFEGDAVLIEESATEPEPGGLEEIPTTEPIEPETGGLQEVAPPAPAPTPQGDDPPSSD